MSEPRITRSEPAASPVRPIAPPPARATAEIGPRMGGDQAAFAGAAGTAAAPTGAGPRQALDNNGWLASTQTFLQGATRAGAMTLRMVRGARVVTTLAEVLEGNAKVIGQGVERATRATSTFFTKVAPRYADDAMKLASPVIRGGGTAIKLLGKVAPVLNVVAATWDTYKAATEDDPAKKTAAWANAGLSIGGTAAALGAVALGATPIGWGLAIGAAGVAGFQLVDNLFFEGKGTQAIGNTVKSIGSGISNGAQKVWGALTSL